MRILAVAGSSGGHIFPAMSLLDTLKTRVPDMEAILVLPRKNICQDSLTGLYDVRYISVRPFKRGVNLYNLRTLVEVIKGIIESLFLLIDFRPDVVIGFGSIASVPAVFFAWMLRIKTLIHEQNAMPGQANMFLARFADRIAVSFDGSAEYFKNFKEKAILTGNPLRKQLVRLDKKSALDFFGFKKGMLTVLVMGGSQGSSSINRAFLEALSGLPERDSLQLIHLCGSADEGYLKKRYEELKVNARTFSFFDSMQYAYSAADLAICRAGSATIHELMHFRLPAIIVPYPFANNHQAANAAVLKKKGCAIIIEEKGSGLPEMEAIFKSTIEEPARLESMALNFSVFKSPDSAVLLADQIAGINLT